MDFSFLLSDLPCGSSFTNQAGKEQEEPNLKQLMAVLLLLGWRIGRRCRRRSSRDRSALACSIRAQPELVERHCVNFACGAYADLILKLLHRIPGFVIPLPCGHAFIRAVFLESSLNFPDAIGSRDRLPFDLGFSPGF